MVSTYDVKQLPADDKYPTDCIKHFVNLECADVKNHFQRKGIERSWEEIVKGRLFWVKRERIAINQIACRTDNALPNLVLIKGAPGVGKTTLSWELCRRWSRHELWTDYSLVLLLRLRDENIQAATSAIDLFHFDNAGVPPSTESDIQSTHIQGAGILFILDGLDELPQKIREDRNSIFMKLVTGCVLPASTVLVTTRPWAMSDLPKYCSSRLDQLIEILGFSHEQVLEYVSKLISDKEAPAEIQAYLDTNPHISSAMYNPLYARIVVEVYRECFEDENRTLPNTITELYTEYCRVLIEGYLIHHPVEEEWNGDLWNLPQSLQPQFNHLCEIAYQGISKEKQRLIFFKEDIPNARATLGFMNSVHPLHQSAKRKVCPSYNFIHLTLQEFLAAVYVWRDQTPQEQMILFETKCHEGRYSTILLFLAGLTKFDDPWTRCVLPVPVFGKSSTNICKFSTTSILWLQESQNLKLIGSYEGVTVQVNLCHYGHLSEQYFIALAYLLAVGKFQISFKVFKVKNVMSSDLDNYVDIAEFAIINRIVSALRKYKQCLSQLKFISLSSNALGNDSVSSLLQLVRPTSNPGPTVCIMHTCYKKN